MKAREAVEETVVDPTGLGVAWLAPPTAGTTNTAEGLQNSTCAVVPAVVVMMVAGKVVVAVVVVVVVVAAAAAAAVAATVPGPGLLLVIVLAVRAVAMVVGKLAGMIVLGQLGSPKDVASESVALSREVAAPRRRTAVWTKC